MPTGANDFVPYGYDKITRRRRFDPKSFAVLYRKNPDAIFIGVACCNDVSGDTGYTESEGLNEVMISFVGSFTRQKG